VLVVVDVVARDVNSDKDFNTGVNVNQTFLHKRLE
jgi:hypothetical protein